MAQDRGPGRVTMTVGATQGPPDPPAPSSPHRLWPWVLGIVLALVAAGVVAQRQSTPPVVTTATLFGGASMAAPDAPDRQVSQRWVQELRRGSDPVGVAVTADLVVVQVERFAADLGDRATEVIAYDRVTGDAAWSHTIEPPTEMGSPDGRPAPPAVVVVDNTTAITIDAPGQAWVPRSAIVALDVDDGTEAWRTTIEGEGWIEVHAQRSRAVVHMPATDDATSPGPGVHAGVIDLVDGAVVFSRDEWLVPTVRGWLGQDILSDPGSWSVLDDDGTLVSTVRSDSMPVRTDDGLVSVVGQQVTAVDDTGDPHWTTDLPGTDPIPATEVDVALADLGAGSLLAGAFRTSDNEVGRMERFVASEVTADGVVTPLGDTSAVALAWETGLSPITVDGVTTLACAPNLGALASACPADLALVGLDGDVAASVDGVTITDDLLRAQPLPGVPTTAGLLVHEGDALRMRDWSTLAARWDIRVPPDGATAVVATTATGVAVGLGGGAPSLTWLS